MNKLKRQPKPKVDVKKQNLQQMRKKITAETKQGHQDPRVQHFLEDK